MLFTTQTQLLGSLRTAQAVGNYERRFQALVNTPLLIIDDFGLKPLRPPEDESFHDLVAERYERAATILTSNLDFGEWGDAFAGQQNARRRHPGSHSSWRLPGGPGGGQLPQPETHRRRSKKRR